MTQADFEFIRSLAYENTGIVLPERKKHMVYSRLSRRLRQLKLTNFAQYCSYVSNTPDERMNFINALTTNLTAFFREEHHFSYLEQVIVPQWKKENKNRLRIWSSACSTGEEPYSIAMTLEKHFPSTKSDLKILATDLDTNVLQKAAAGTYSCDSVTNLPDRYTEKYVSHTPDNQHIQMRSNIQKMIHFKQLNLLEKWPMTGPFDIIFCRNVLIYFDNETKKKIIAKFRKMLSPHGYLFIGHSETLMNISEEFDLIGQTIYRPLGHGGQKLTKPKG
ncbi:protein-glutamate O-methyltransferase CheR [Shewanella sp. VB17]|uniref:CheR family methyltransferase n=1 Tax=Shewanella sp. VB17 TaxID=2739432 RepID=UPI0015664474|nr:protein-glutamate O-methyltransferase CheR [Shewanella sp. VB17]NRD72266.1 protein-glutamate O-methyltransferase CheR [Shewanella sp. VB17]